MGFRVLRFRGKGLGQIRGIGFRAWSVTSYGR